MTISLRINLALISCVSFPYVFVHNHNLQEQWRNLRSRIPFEHKFKKLAASYETRSAIYPYSEPHESSSQAEPILIEHPFNIITHWVHLLFVLFPSHFLTKSVYVCLCPIHPIHFDLINGNIFHKKYEVWSSFLLNFLKSSVNNPIMQEKQSKIMQ